ncbi:MAG: hypothetical protein ACLR13_04015 [Acutalibacteraceae bacterium]
MKKDTVTNAVSGVMDKIALSHPEISLRFIRDGRKPYIHGRRTVKIRHLCSIWQDFTAGLIPVDYKFEHVKVWDLSAETAAASQTAACSLFYRRKICQKAKTAMVALEQAFKGP